MRTFFRPLLPMLLLAMGSMLALGFTPTTVSAESLLLTPKAESLIAKTQPRLINELRWKGFTLGQPIFIRIFKLPAVLELWMDSGRGFRLFKRYNICTFSGFLGPKLNEGDAQSPEGFYRVSADQMNPRSRFHLSFDIGYPNTYDLSHNRTGAHIMVHGNCQSIGCFAMGNRRIEEIYLLAHAALSRGQRSFDVHIFPFPLNREHLQQYAKSPWIAFWKTLTPAYQAFEQTHRVPRMAVQNGKYVMRSHPPSQLAMKRN